VVVVPLLVLGAGLLTWNWFRPLPAVQASASVPAATRLSGAPPALPWPGAGSAAVAVAHLGMIGSSGNERPVPAASVTKVMTALIVLEDKPLKKGESGPSITITDQDVQTYLSDKAAEQSVVEVRAGEKLAEFEALEGMLIPSGNNIAETLARWDAGSVNAFVDKMNSRAKALGLTHTTFADPAGASVQSVSTPSDLVVLGMAAMQQDVIAQVVALPSAQLPVAGVVFNVDYVLGQSGIIGIKTGSGLNYGANFLFAATATVNGHSIVLFGCVMGQPTLEVAFEVAEALIAAMQTGLSVHQVIVRNQTVGSLDTPWGNHADVISTVDLTLIEWPGMILRERLDAHSFVIDRPVPAGTAAGTLHVVLGDYKLDLPLVTGSSVYPPSRLWRLTRFL
jgi:D-alanyl-D-alanine carboxypeptidase (penicillin-binding protein 5/6)